MPEMGLYSVQNMMHESIVPNYLNCDLDDFGINMEDRIIRIPQMPRE